MHCRRRFRRDPHDVAGARRFVAAVLTESGVELDAAVVDVALLAVSELATNAIEHAESDFEVSVDVDSVVRIAVHDGSPTPPVPRDASADDVSGRGMSIIDAVCDAWGVVTEAAGKHVWCELRLPAPAGS